MVEVVFYTNSRCGVEGIMLPPIVSALENAIKNDAETRIFPPLDRTTVYVGSKCELGISRLTDPEAVIIRNRNVEFDLVRR